MLISVLRDLFNRQLSFKNKKIDMTTFLPKRSAPDQGRTPNFFAPVFWSTSDPAAVVASAKSITESTSAGHHFADNLLTWGRNMSMLDDLPFVDAWKSNADPPPMKRLSGGATYWHARRTTAFNSRAISSNVAPTPGSASRR